MEMFDVLYQQYYRHRVAAHGRRTPMRIVESYELEFYTTAEGYSYVNGRKYAQQKGMVLLARTGDVRQSENRFECYATHFDCTNPEFAKKYLQNLPNVTYLPKSERLFRELIMSRPTNTLSRHLHQESLLLHIFSEMHEGINTESAESAKVSPDNLYKINQSIQYIKENFKTRIDIDTLGEMVYMSRSGFFLLFKTVTNMTPSDYINTVRIEHAKMLLDTTNMSFVEIAMECGFNSQSYFNSVFKEKTAITPREYQKNLII